MRILISKFRSAAARFAVSRALVVAILLGPVAGAMLAFAAVAARDLQGRLTRGG